ncbi:hypothetical protein M2H09_22495 [Vibrio vulnificus]|nr:hypothetical protein [Vibrio vulnificus]
MKVVSKKLVYAAFTP